MEANSKATLWIPSICEQSVSLDDGETYHLQGMDGPKRVLDQSSLIEPWLPNYDDCVEGDKRRCLTTKCGGIKNGKKRKTCFESRLNELKCKTKAKETCFSTKKFEKYLSNLRGGGSCEEDVCSA